MRNHDDRSSVSSDCLSSFIFIYVPDAFRCLCSASTLDSRTRHYVAYCTSQIAADHNFSTIEKFFTWRKCTERGRPEIVYTRDQPNGSLVSKPATPVSDFAYDLKRTSDPLNSQVVRRDNVETTIEECRPTQADGTGRPPLSVSLSLYQSLSLSPDHRATGCSALGSSIGACSSGPSQRPPICYLRQWEELARCFRCGNATARMCL